MIDRTHRLTRLALPTLATLIVTTAAAMGEDARPQYHPPSKTISCEALASQFHKNRTTVTSATVVPAADPLPAYCDVRGLIGRAPEPGKGIRFALWLPVKASWNERFYMVGGGGYAGTLSLNAMGNGLRQGYATATTDTGHDASVFPLATFAYNDRQSEKDYAYRAVHETVETAKALIKAHYGAQPMYNYWVGCSTGGRQGLMEAQRYPNDFDGLVVGAPVLEFADTQIGGAWVAKALMGDGAIPDSKLPLLAATELAVCDGVDGLEDGQITDPRYCPFDARRDLPACSGLGDGPDCFTTAQREAVHKAYDGPRTSSGVEIFPGYAVGTAVFGPNSGWIPWFQSPGILGIFAETFFQYMAFPVDPGPDYVW
jgi:feruloyl esterase